MATQAPNSPTPTEQTPGPESLKPEDGNGQDVEREPVITSPERPYFRPSEPMREDQVQNAVKFLAHPKVRGSPVIYRRSFLEKKGLTKEEIDEAFRRVPDPPSNASTGAAATASQPKPSASLQPLDSSNLPQAAASPVSNNSLVSSMQQSRVHWFHALIAAGVLAASGAGTVVLFKKIIVPRLKSWIREVVAEENELEKEDKSHSVLAEQTAEAAKSAAAAAAIVAKASEGLMKSKNEERKYFDTFLGMMDVQVKEMKSMGEAILKLESTSKDSYFQDNLMKDNSQSTIGRETTYHSWRTPQVNQPNSPISSVIPKDLKLIGTPNPNYGAVSPSAAATVEHTTAPHPKSYMEIMEMIQRGEKPPNIREINDMPPNPNQQPTKSLLQPRPKPWQVAQRRLNQPSNGGPSSGSASTHFNGNYRDASDPQWRIKGTEGERSVQLQQQQRYPYGSTDGEGSSRAFDGLGPELESSSSSSRE